MKKNYFISSLFWSFFSKIFAAISQFISIPLLLNYLGKETYGVLSLAIATNAYMQLMDLGFNIGAIKFYAQWRSEGRKDLLERVSRTSISFYGIIGAANALVLTAIAIFGKSLFVLTIGEFRQFQVLLGILAVFSIVNWATAVYSQLLTADEKIAFVQMITSIRIFLNVLVIGMTILFRLSLNGYFTLFLASNIIIVIPFYAKCKQTGLIHSFLPQFYWKEFNIIFRYSLAIFAMSLFQYTATQSRAIVLGMFSKNGIGILTEFRVIEVFPIFINSMGGMLTIIFLPKSSKLVAKNDKEKIGLLAYEGTLYTSILVAMLCFPIILCAKEAIVLYVGATYGYLYKWLALWCFITILFLYNTPVASLVLATGKTRALVVSSAVSCVISIVINIVLCKTYGIGSAIIGFGVYIVIQMLFYYLYFNTKILNLKSMLVFKSFILPTGLATIAFVVSRLINIRLSDIVLQSVVRVALWGSLYLGSLVLLKIINIRTMKSLMRI